MGWGGGRLRPFHLILQVRHVLFFFQTSSSSLLGTKARSGFSNTKMWVSYSNLVSFGWASPTSNQLFNVQTSTSEFKMNYFELKSCLLPPTFLFQSKRFCLLKRRVGRFTWHSELLVKLSYTKESYQLSWLSPLWYFPRRSCPASSSSRRTNPCRSTGVTPSSWSRRAMRRRR